MTNKNSPNQKNVSAYVALTGKTVNIKDAYEEEGYDFEGTINFDKKNGYRSKSFLTVPLKNHENEIIGVMQLINAQNDHGDVISFNEEMQEQVESLASQGAVALTNKRLVEELKTLFEAFIKLIATAIDKKSDMTQRDLSNTLGISLGKINYCINALKEKGLIKIGKFSESKNKLAVRGNTE